jgi:hypothetical protein
MAVATKVILIKMVEMEEEDIFIEKENGLRGNSIVTNWYICMKFLNEKQTNIFVVIIFFRYFLKIIKSDDK